MEKRAVDISGSRAYLAAKVERLERQLVSLKRVLGDAVETHHSADSVLAFNPYPDLSAAPGRTAAEPMLDSYWLGPTLKFLCLNPLPGSIYWLLERLGGALDLRAISFWHWDPVSHSPSVLGAWQLPGTAPVNDSHWQGHLGQAHDVRARLEAGEPLVLAALPGMLEQGLDTSLVMPARCDQALAGLMVLHTGEPRSWHPEDLLVLDVLADCLLTISERQREQQQLQERNRRYQFAMAASNDGFWEWNLASDDIFFSGSYLQMLGYKEEALPATLETLRAHFVHPDDSDNLLQELRTAAADDRTQLTLQYRMIHSAGHILWVATKAHFFDVDESGRATRMIASNTDITPLLDAQDELINVKIQADMASKIKSEFLARISHEIRTPMNAIIGVGYLLQDASLDEQQQSYLTSINSAADSLLHIINQVLDFSKIETGRVILEQSHFDLRAVLDKIARLFDISALHRAVRIEYDLGPGVPRHLRGDAQRLGQILNHLLSNAFQYSGQDQVRVQVVRKAHQPGLSVLEFTVEDQGQGMSAETLARVRASLEFPQSQRPVSTPSGLGICNYLVRLMHGTMAFDSAPGRGCRVVFSASFEPSHLGDDQLVAAPRTLNNMRALIVDDNNIARTIIASTARSLNLQVEEADQPLVALDKIRRADSLGQPYHLVLLDYRMPGINGLQLTGMIKKDRNLRVKPLVFLISAYHRDEISSTDPNAILVDEFLSKPVSQSRLFETISQVIDRDHPLQKISPPVAISQAQLNTLRNARVLVAEDNLVNQRVICGILSKREIITHVANNGRQALDAILAAEHPFDAILMDLEMPEMDGLESTREIRQLPGGELIPIIAVTAQAMGGDRERCLEAGMDAYLSKPVNPDLLYTTLADMLGSRDDPSDPPED